MKLCNSEAMKLIKELELQKKALLFSESSRCTVSYKEGETKQPANYDYADTRKKIAELDAQVRKIKNLLAYANCTVQVEGFDMTIGEGLVYLAQLNGEYDRLCTLAEREKLSRRITMNGVLEYTEAVYEPEKVAEDKLALHQKICKLQVAIDRANLTNFIEL